MMHVGSRYTVGRRSKVRSHEGIVATTLNVADRGQEFSLFLSLLSFPFSLSAMAKKSHHFCGIQQYADELMDLAEGRPAFAGRGKKPSNKEVLAEIASFERCKKARQGSFFSQANSTANKSCSCG